MLTINSILLILTGLAVLLIAYAGIRSMQQRRRYALEIEESEDLYDSDDILGVRKIVPHMDASEHSKAEIEQQVNVQEPAARRVKSQSPEEYFILNVFAKDGKKFAGYELLQSLLTVGMRFGDMSIFHRHREKNGKGTILFSLASATQPGTFDINRIGAYESRGLTLFMALSGNTTIDAERYTVMIETAQQLAEDLDGDLLNQQRKLIGERELEQYETKFLTGAEMDDA